MAASQNKMADTPEIRALLELERRSIAGDQSITPEIQNQVKSKLQGYRAQGIVPNLKGNDPDALEKVSNVFDSINQAKGRIGTTTSGIIGSVASKIPGTNRKALEADITTLKANLAFDELSKLRAQSPTGGALGQVSDAEEKLLAGAVASLDPDQPSDDLKRNLEKVNRHYENYLKSLGYDDNAIQQAQVPFDQRKEEAPPAVAPGGNAPPPNGSGPQAGGGPAGGGDSPYGPASTPPDMVSLATGSTRREVDPQASSLIDALVRHGATADQINAELKRQGLDQGIGAVTQDQVSASQAYLKQHPNYNGSFGRVEREVPTTAFQRAAAGPIGAAAVGAGQAVTGNRLASVAGALGGDEEKARALLQLSEQSNPKAALAGNIAGSLPLAIGGELALGRAGLGPGVARSALSNAAYGAYEGSGANPNNPVTGAVLGGALGAAGGAGGEIAAQGIGRAIAPTGGKLAPLYEAGVRPTIGQRFSGSGTAGGLVNAAEEALGSIPVIGAGIRGARDTARVQYQTGAFNQALADIGQKLPDDITHGAPAHSFMQKAFNDAYTKARNGLSFVPDAQYGSDKAALLGDVATSGVYDAGQQKKINDVISNAVDSRLSSAGGQLSGEAYQQAVSKVQQAARKLSGSDPLVSDALNDFAGVLDNTARRSSSPEAVAALDAADSGYAKAVRIEQAAAARGGGDVGDFTPKQLDAAVQTASGGVRNRAYLRGDALLGDYAQAGKSLTDKLPNSGTAERALTGSLATGGLGALGSVTPVGAALTGSLGALYAPGVRDAVGAILAPRGSQKLRTLRDIITNNDYVLGSAGGLGSTGALQFLPTGP